jgi:hypothetical protein
MKQFSIWTSSPQFDRTIADGDSGIVRLQEINVLSATAAGEDPALPGE